MTTPDWAGQLREVGRRHPAAGHPRSGCAGRHPAPLEDILTLLPGRVQRTRYPAHLPGPVRLLHGHVLDELQELIENPDETDDLHRLPIGELPQFRGLAPVLAAHDGAAELERGLDILLTGRTTTLTPQAKPARPHQHSAPPADPPLPRPGRHLWMARHPGPCLAPRSRRGPEAWSQP
jgi:hypothetical protein